MLGWQSTLIDGRSSLATRERFPLANKIIAAKAEDVLSYIEIDKQSVFVLITHNYEYDLCILKQLIYLDILYIGILGPRKKLNRMLEQMKTDGFIINESHKSKIFSPIGLDIGAETPEEIALSITAEIKTVLSAANGKMLKDKKTPIHVQAVA
jgi:xanthine/CO dehydrogenase XdhC/CoxF family maturation factor